MRRWIWSVALACSCSAAGGAPPSATAASAEPAAKTVTRLHATPGSDVVAVDSDGAVALWHGDGRLMWRSKLESQVETAPVISLGGSIYLRTPNAIVALDGRGAKLWQVTTPPPPAGQWDGIAARADSSLLFVDATGALVCYGREGSRRWRWTPPAPITVAVAPAPDSTTYVRAGEHLVRLGVDGVERWTK